MLLTRESGGNACVHVFFLVPWEVKTARRPGFTLAGSRDNTVFFISHLIAPSYSYLPV